jgi:hypothetical protein
MSQLAAAVQSTPPAHDGVPAHSTLQAKLGGQ